METIKKLWRGGYVNSELHSKGTLKFFKIVNIHELKRGALQPIVRFISHWIIFPWNYANSFENIARVWS